MRVAVLGGGVIGVTTAYYLTKAGHKVTVIDRRSGPGLETSFANAGEISPGYASPWAAPGVPLKALKWLFMEHAPLKIRPMLSAEMLIWLARLLCNCSPSSYARNKRRMVGLAEYSRDMLAALRRETGINYDERMQGTLQLFRDEKQLLGIGKDTEVLEQYGTSFEVLDREGCIASEPGLAYSKARFAGGLRLPNDETGDCYKFTKALAEKAKSEGTAFRFDETVERLVQGRDGIAQAVTNKDVIEADAFVVSLGSYSPALLKPLGIRLPVYPVKGYSLTLDIKNDEGAPVSTLLDESYKVAITRLGDRIRVGGLAEIAGFDGDLPVKRRKTLEHSFSTLFPDAGEVGEATFWSGLRPMTPDGTPVVGGTGIPNLFLNTGHGTLGWTMACGSGRIVSDLISGLTPDIECGDLAASRYQ